MFLAKPHTLIHSFTKDAISTKEKYLSRNIYQVWLQKVEIKIKPIIYWFVKKAIYSKVF